MEKIVEIKKELNELQTPKGTININDSQYLYSILKLDKEEGIKIKLFESKPKTNIYYEYEGSISELTKNIKILLLCENLDEIITTLKAAFDEGKAKFVEKEEKYYIELSFEAMGKSKISTIQLTKYEPKDPITELNDKIKKIEYECNNLSKEIDKLKNMKVNDKDVKEKIIEALQENDIKMKLFEEFEKLMCSKYSLDNHKNQNKIKEDDKTEFNEAIKSIEEKLNEKVIDLDNIKSNLEKIENNYIDKTNFIPEIDKNIKNNKLIKKISDDINSLKINKNNYIELKIYVPKNNTKAKLIQQCETYKYFYNFERDDIEVIIDGENVSLDILKRNENFNSNNRSSNCYEAQRLAYNLGKTFDYYWIFEKEGIHIIKILFRKNYLIAVFCFTNVETSLKLICQILIVLK
jgi:hypothetical protein